MAEPNEAPVDGPAESVDSSPAQSGLDWSNITSRFESDPEEDEPLVLEDLSEDSEPEAEPEPEVAAAPEPEPVKEPEPEPAPVAEVPQEQPKVEEPAVVETPAEPEPAPALTQEQINDLRQNYINEIQSRYSMSDDEALAFQADPQQSLPLLAARVHAAVLEEAVQTVTQTMIQMLPAYVENLVNTRETRGRNQNAFYDRFPELKEHDSVVKQVGQLYRQMNPNAKLDDFIQDVGSQVWLRVGLPVAQLASKFSSPDSSDAAPAAPAAPRPVGLTPNPPGPQTPIPALSENPFDALLSQWESEENEDF